MKSTTFRGISAIFGWRDQRRALTLGTSCLDLWCRFLPFSMKTPFHSDILYLLLKAYCSLRYYHSLSWKTCILWPREYDKEEISHVFYVYEALGSLSTKSFPGTVLHLFETFSFLNTLTGRATIVSPFHRGYIQKSHESKPHKTLNAITRSVFETWV